MLDTTNRKRMSAPEASEVGKWVAAIILLSLALGIAGLILAGFWRLITVIFGWQ